MTAKRPAPAAPYVRRIHPDDWVGVLDKGLLIDSPNWPDVEAAIKSLDGGRRTLVMLEPADQSKVMCVAGNGTWFLVYANLGDRTNHNLRDTVRPEAGVEMSLGGQGSEYLPHQLVTLETALRAAEAWFWSGALDPGLTWERE